MPCLLGAKVLLGLCLAISTRRHAWGMGRTDFKTTGSRAKKKRIKTHKADFGSNVGRLTNPQIAGFAELHALKHHSFLFAGQLSAGLQ